MVNFFSYAPLEAVLKWSIPFLLRHFQPVGIVSHAATAAFPLSGSKIQENYQKPAIKFKNTHFKTSS